MKLPAISRYEVLEELGRGGMGVVYKARDTALDRLVAIKRLPATLADNPARLVLLRREAQTIAALSHPRIVTIYSIEEIDQGLCLVMEYVEGRTLARAIPPGGLPLDRFLPIAIPLADALSTAHEGGIVHRDLKPGNIMLSQDGRPKILDFGLARLRPAAAGKPESQLPTAGISLVGPDAGTPPYMSPEQLCHEPVDHRSDIFSFGIVLYEMATGRYPFRRDDVASSLLRDAPEPVEEARPDLPPQLGRIIGHCLEKDPKDRTQSAADLRHQLVDLQSESATGPAVAHQARGTGRRFMLPLIGLLVLAAAWLAYELLPTTAPATPPRFVQVVESRIFPGERGPEHFRQGLVGALRESVGRLSGTYPPGSEVGAIPAFLGPLPDFTIQADALVAGQRLRLGFRLLEPAGEVAGGVVEGDPDKPFELVDRVGQEIAVALGRAAGVKVRYRSQRPPTDDPLALDRYLEAAADPDRDGPAPATRLAWLAEALDRDPRFSLAMVLEGELLLAGWDGTAEDSNLSAAQSTCARAARLDPKLASAHACIGKALQRSGSLLEAAAALSRALVLDVADLESHLALRECHLGLGLPASSSAAWLEVIDRHPNHWAGFYSLGAWHQDRQHYDLAAEQYRSSLELAPRNPRVHAFLGTAYIFAGRYEDAAVSLQASNEMQPNWTAYYNLGGLQYTLRQFDAAVASFERAVELRESDYRSHGRLGWASFWLPERATEARRHLLRAVELAREHLESAPDDASAVILTAVYHAMLGNRAETLEAIDRARRLRPNFAHNYFLAAVAHNHLGDTEAAIDWVERAVTGGYSTAEIRTIVDFENLQNEPRFQRALGNSGEKAAAAVRPTLERRGT